MTPPRVLKVECVRRDVAAQYSGWAKPYFRDISKLGTKRKPSPARKPKREADAAQTQRSCTGFAVLTFPQWARRRLSGAMTSKITIRSWKTTEAERNRVGRKTQPDKNTVYTNKEIGHKHKHGHIQSLQNKERVIHHTGRHTGWSHMAIR